MYATNLSHSLNLKGRLFSLDRPKIMGILNITPDSFYDGGNYNTSFEFLLEKVESLLSNGADILDIGGASSRPNAPEVSPEEEERRVVWAIKEVLKVYPDTIISVDTYRASVAEAGINAGAHIINDVSGGNLDEQMFETVAKLQVPYILMHMRGTPSSMGDLTDYNSLTNDIIDELQVKINQLKHLGCKDIIIDPGFGFAKNINQNFELLKNVTDFHILDLPLLIGISRKSMIYKSIDCTPDKALNGTTVLNTLAIQKGANILRVHDAKEAKEVITLLDIIKGV